MEDEDYRIMVLNDTTIKCFRDGRIERLFKVNHQYGKKGEWVGRTNKRIGVTLPKDILGIKINGEHKFVSIIKRNI